MFAVTGPIVGQDRHTTDTVIAGSVVLAAGGTAAASALAVAGADINKAIRARAGLRILVSHTGAGDFVQALVDGTQY